MFFFRSLRSLENGAFEFLPGRFRFARVGFRLVVFARSNVAHQVEKHLQANKQRKKKGWSQLRIGPIKDTRKKKTNTLSTCSLVLAEVSM